MQQHTGAQACVAIAAWAVVAITVPLFGLLLLPVLAVATAGRALVRTAETVARLLRPA
jgi:hypothetical protein